MATFFRDRCHQVVMILLAVLILLSSTITNADDCKRVSNILVLFDASGYMKEKDRYQQFLTQMGFFVQGMPLTADGFFNVGLRHYGLKVGMGCENTESILAIQPWDPEKFVNAFPRSVSYGVSALSAGLRGAADDASQANGKTAILVIGGGVESCKADPGKIAEQMMRNNPDLEIHTFQLGAAQEGTFYLRQIAEMGKGSFVRLEEFNSPASWYGWMKKNLLVQCPSSVVPPSKAAISQALAPVTFDVNSTSVTSKDPSANAANMATLQAVGQALKANPNMRVVLHTYSDGKGSPEQSLKLSRKRAEAVVKLLISKYGVRQAQMGIVAHGATQLGPQAPGTPERFSRRVEFEIIQ
ncbi:MAG: OmpA family protein [Desulfomonile tiedjei]|uniref:OmpA family protein n=1 Tax=Desulfomonile tiedjei TaxID=2358 RepID=A0A9D6V7C9_9BACT|nr:OmpA family protein [Desulfomonile tiedjei]